MYQRRCISYSCLTLLTVLCAAPHAGGITLSQDLDSGSLDVAASSVQGNTVRLVGRRTWTDGFYDAYWRWVHFEASGAQGLTPQFRIDDNSFLGSLSGHRFVYSYDQQDWQYFDQGSFQGSDYVFGNTTAFTQDRVTIAYGLPYTTARTNQRVATWSQSPYVMPTLSGNSQLVIGQTAGGVDDTGRTISPRDLYGLRITDPTAIGHKTKVLLATGSHSAETTGSHVLEGMVDFLLSDDPRASQLRGRAEFYVYPQTNPDGRFAGYYRSNPENPDKDYNRYYNNPAGFTDLSTITSAMRADTNGDVDYLFDFHSWWGPWSGDNFVFTVSDLIDAPFLQALSNREPALDRVSSSGQPGMLRIWGMSSSGLRAENAFTPEFGFHPNVFEDRYDLYGENFSLALLDVLGSRTACDLNVDDTCDLLDVNLLTSVGNLVTGVMGADPKYDLDGNGTVNQDDLQEWLSLAATANGLSSPYLLGDADLNGLVDGSDFNSWNGRKFTSGTVWEDGDFNADGVADGTDFNSWNSNKFLSSATVPEPLWGWWAPVVAYVVTSRFRSQR